MRRVVLLLTAIGALGGCQAQNPYAAFGPQTIAAPKTSQTPRYYPATGTPRTNASPTWGSQRLSVSAEGSPAEPAPRIGFAADPADRQPIRVVENPAAAARTAAASKRAANPEKTQTTPGNPPKSNSAPRMQPSTGGASGTPRRDPAVIPAGYQQAPPAFIETPSEVGQWRAR